MQQRIRSPHAKPRQDRRSNFNPSTRPSQEPQPVEPSLRSPEGVLRLQQTIGNQAVARMIARERASGVQRALNAKLTTEQNATAFDDLGHICQKFGIKKKDLVTPVKDALFQGALFPDTYKNRYDASPELQTEMAKIVNGLDGLIAASNSQTVINAAANDANAVGTQLVAALGGAINAAFLNGFGHYKTLNTLGQDSAGAYVNFLDVSIAKFTEYTNQTKKSDAEFDYSEKADTVRNRLDVFSKQAKALKTELNNAINQQQSTDAIIARIKTFTTEIAAFENAWDLDFLIGKRKIDDKIGELARDQRLGGHYEVGGGTEDDMSVKEAYNPNLACTLFAILALKPGWLGAEHPRDLHSILRKTGQLKDYDDDRTAGKLRYLAGLTPTIVGDQNKRLGEFLQQRKQANQKDSFIVDAEDLAHTFAVVWKSDKFVRVDEASPPDGGGFGAYLQKKVLAIWK